jgi:hypothetical protein
VNVLARIISYVFHPLLMPTYLLLMLSLILPSALYPVSIEQQYLFIIFVVFVTFFFPVLILSFLKMFGAISSFTLENRKERILPFFCMAIIYAGTMYPLIARNRINVDDNLFKFLIIIECLVLMAALITIFYKVSIHAMGSMGVVGILIPLNIASDNQLIFVATLIAFVVAGIVMSARLQLNAHTPRQVLIGALAGVCIGFFGMIILF